MVNLLLSVLAVTLTCCNNHLERDFTQLSSTHSKEILALIHSELGYPRVTIKPINEIKIMLQNDATALNPDVIEKTIAALTCAQQRGLEHNPILTIIDFSRPSNLKRLWVYDVSKNQRLFHTFVSHGIKSGALLSNHFSNIRNSKTSSIGIFTTENAYTGRHGTSLKLKGLDGSFNSNAYNRFIVMHGSWYMNKNFINKYGRPGRSWGCPSVPLHLTKPIINTIKDNSLLIAYHKDENWQQKSKYLNCQNREAKNVVEIINKKKSTYHESREPILFYDRNKNNKREDNDPIVTLTAEHYQQFFNTKPPLKRMLRRQLNGGEYIALSPTELVSLKSHPERNNLTEVKFIIPVVKKLRGYYATEMKIVPLGTIKAVNFNQTTMDKARIIQKYTVSFANQKTIQLTVSNRFIRWLGL